MMMYRINSHKETSRGVSLFLVVMMLFAALPMQGQKLITYDAGMGTRHPDDPDVWVLYQQVTARHEGMTLHADSAHLNTVLNNFDAYGHVRVDITDTTTLYGDRIFYDGTSRVVNVWCEARRGRVTDSVRLVDGRTLLKTPHLLYDRNTSTATYNNGAVTTHDDKRLVSRQGDYNSDTKIVYIYTQVVFTDSNMRMETDTLIYNMTSHIADYWSPTRIYTDSAYLYSESGSYDTDLRYALSTQASHVENDGKTLDCDTLHYYEEREYGKAIGNVSLFDSANNCLCLSRYAETDQSSHTSFVTDSALVMLMEKPDTTATADTMAVTDTLYIHADSIIVVNDSSRQLLSVNAFHHAKGYRSDGQFMADSVFYHVQDSLVELFYQPVLWYDDYQLTADTILATLDSNGFRQVLLNSNCKGMGAVDDEKYNQLKGARGVVSFVAGDIHTVDVLGNTEVVYYVTEELKADSLTSDTLTVDTLSVGQDSVAQDTAVLGLIGINAGTCTDMRLCFADGEPIHAVMHGHPDMRVYPLSQLPEDKRRLPGFQWFGDRRPRVPLDVFRW